MPHSKSCCCYRYPEIGSEFHLPTQCSSNRPVLPEKDLPITSLPKGDWPHLSALKLAYPEFNVSKPIDVLLGVDVHQNILKPGLILGPKGTSAAQNTISGWVLFGNVSNRQSTSEVTTLRTSTSIPSCGELLKNSGP